jgi:GNAT superfamily N-acetyltransferase
MVEPGDAPPSILMHLPDGTAAVIRPVTPDDGPLLVAGFEHLSDESRYRRFLEATKSLTPAQVHYLTHADGLRHIAWGVTVEDPGTGEPMGIAVARCVRDEADPELAEFAIAVADAWQGRGVGVALARVVAARAWQAGVRRFKGLMLADNKGAFGLMDRLGTLEQRHSESPGVVEAIWRLEPPD